MQEEINKLKREIEELKVWKSNLESSYSIPLKIDQSFRERFPMLEASSKTQGSEDQTVNESGTNSYSVLGSPQRWVKTDVDGTIYIPAYTSLT